MANAAHDRSQGPPCAVWRLFKRTQEILSDVGITSAEQTQRTPASLLVARSRRFDDRVAKRIRDDIASLAGRSVEDKEFFWVHDQALAKVMQHLLKDDTQVYKQFVENESFKRFVGDMVYALTSQ
jgi:hypothetical protein